MKKDIASYLIIKKEVSQALRNNFPVVALETAVLTHGLPYPENIELSNSLETEVRRGGAVPATVGLIDGKIHIGLSQEEIEILGDIKSRGRKISRRDFGIALALKEKGGTTVAGTLYAAHAAGISVFATGGIGGVHRDAQFDISADLPELSKTPMIVVCSGAKAILDLPATVEMLETLGVPIVGYQTDEFPAFYSKESGLPVNVRANTPAEIAFIARAHWTVGLESAILVVVPPPSDVAVPRKDLEDIIQQANFEAHEQNISGAHVTPFLLSRVSELSGGNSLRANLALLQNNAYVAALIAKEVLENKNLRG